MKTKRMFLLAVASLAVISYLIFSLNKKPVSQEDIAAYNNALCEKYESEIFTCIAYVEDFGRGKDSKRFDSDFKSKPYFCGVKWTNGYGSTIYPKGSKIKKGDRKMSKGYAKKCVLAHLQQRIYPFICKYVTRKLDKTEIIGTCMFIYNIGGENFSGYKENGRKSGNPSQFLVALNEHEDMNDCARRMTGFRAAGGNTAKGLLKRHWVQAAVFCGFITAEDLLQLKPSSFYNIKDYKTLYVKACPDKDGYFSYKHDQKTIEWFLKSQASDKNTYKILDKDTQNHFACAD